MPAEDDRVTLAVVVSRLDDVREDIRERRCRHDRLIGHGPALMNGGRLTPPHPR